MQSEAATCTPSEFETTSRTTHLKHTSELTTYDEGSLVDLWDAENGVTKALDLDTFLEVMCNQGADDLVDEAPVEHAVDLAQRTAALSVTESARRRAHAQTEGPPVLLASGVLALGIIVFGHSGMIASFATLLCGLALIDPATRALLAIQPIDVAAGLCSGLTTLCLWGPVYGLVSGALVAFTGIGEFVFIVVKQAARRTRASGGR